MLLQLAVTQDEEGANGFFNVPAEDLIFLEYDMSKKWVLAHTMEDRYYIAGTLTYLVTALKAKGYEFEKVDRNIVVNLPKIKRLDRMNTFAYFEYDVHKSSKRVTLSRKYFDKLLAGEYVRDPHMVII